MNEPLPEGTLTFLFTALDGSPNLRETHSRAMQAVLARHHDLLNQEFGENGGHVLFLN